MRYPLAPPHPHPPGFNRSPSLLSIFFLNFLQAGYPCLSLHGGKEQSDRECTIADFKGAVCNILVATSIAARGLDVRDLVLVVNYDVPNHHEDYVHRYFYMESLSVLLSVCPEASVWQANSGS